MKSENNDRLSLWEGRSSKDSLGITEKDEARIPGGNIRRLPAQAPAFHAESKGGDRTEKNGCLNLELPL